MKTFLNKLAGNAKHLPTTLAGIGAVLAALPQNDYVAHLVGMSPKVAAVVTAIGAIGTALVLIFGTGAKQ